MEDVRNELLKMLFELKLFVFQSDVTKEDIRTIDKIVNKIEREAQKHGLIPKE